MNYLNNIDQYFKDKSYQIYSIIPYPMNHIIKWNTKNEGIYFIMDIKDNL